MSAGRLLVGSSPDESDPDERPADNAQTVLDLSTAIRRALAHNLTLIASAESLLVAQAQLAQAGLIRNPTLGQSNGFIFPISPVEGRGSVDFNIIQEINSIITRPTRVQLARIQRSQAGIDLAAQAFDIALQVEAKFNEVKHLEQAGRAAQQVADVYQRALHAAEARARAGVIPNSELTRALLQTADARRQVGRSMSQRDRAARELNVLMGRNDAPTWTIESEDSAFRAVEIPEEDEAERIASSARLDLGRARFDDTLAAVGVKLTRLNSYPQITAGIEMILDSGGHFSAGPAFSVTLPIFDTGEAAMAGALAQQRQAAKKLAALEQQVAQDVRTALSQTRIAEDDVRFYAEQMIPQQQHNADIAEQAFENGVTDFDSLLNGLRDYAAAVQAYTESLDAYRSSLVALERAAGCTVPRLRAGMMPDAMSGDDASTECPTRTKGGSP
jgi:cobalt-zinc-cadmium efflux system outer membrane protein